MSNSRTRAPARERLTSVGKDGSRVAIHPTEAKGKFLLWRRIVAIFLILVYGSLPWIRIGGYPAVFLDTDHLRFHFFGITFASQDLWLAFFLISGLGFGLFYVTALAGRVWCGWACPQTVFLEHVFRFVEKGIEGDGPARKQLDQAPWTLGKIAKRGLKHGAFILLSLAVAHLLMAYFVSLPKVWEMMSVSPKENWKAFLFVFIFSGILYFNFAWFREQLCIIICPYGRLQSALIDDHSMVIGYDEKRGEPRGKPKDSIAGDCIDCCKCVQVCPTGIDIRQGLQIECIGCAACIDSCDTVMDKLKRPRGLIRYDSQRGLEGEKTKILRPRIFLYSALLVLGVAVLLFSIRGLSNATMTAWRVQGAPYIVDASSVRNHFIIRVTNKDNAEAAYRVDILGEPDDVEVIGVSDPLVIEGNGERMQTILLIAPKQSYRGSFRTTVIVENSDGRLVAERELQFLGPSPGSFSNNE